MPFNRNSVSLGPYTPKQKLYLQTEDGVAMEGEFVKFNALQTSVLLHRVELIPSDGRTFDQYNAVLSELVCLHPLEHPTVNDNTVTSTVLKKHETVPDNTNDLVLPELDNSEEARKLKAVKFESKLSLLRQRLRESGFSKDGNCTTDVPASTCKDTPELKLSTTGETDSNELMDRKNTSPEKNGVKDSSSEPKVTNGIYEALKSKARGYIVIDKPGPLLHSAMEDIQKRSSFGLGCHGADKGRLDRLSLLTVATESCVYLLDVQALGKQVLTPTLIKALESTSVEKITYDCRYLSDCLYYSHRIRLQNIYDVQAADCVLFRCRKGSFPNRGRGLDELVSHYLNLPAALLANNTNITNYKVWYQRPLKEECFEFAAWQIVSLSKLRVALDKTFQNLMTNSFDVYLSHIRKMSRKDAVETHSTRRQIPVELLDAPFTRDS